MGQDVLHICVLLAAAGTAEVVEVLDGGKEEVNDSDDDCDTKGIAPNDNAETC